MKAVQAVIASNGVPYFQMRSVGSYSTPGREKKGMNEGKYRPFVGVIPVKKSSNDLAKIIAVGSKYSFFL